MINTLGSNKKSLLAMSSLSLLLFLYFITHITCKNIVVNEWEKILHGSGRNIYTPDEYLDVPQVIARHGYPSETHTIVTEDGYILNLHRIPGSKNGTRGGLPIFLQHGLLGSSADWIINGNNSLGFLLANEGYDVWLGNARGNTYSKAHVTLKVDSYQFWNFSWHEMGTKDLPACFYHVGEITGKPKDIQYIGHSMGTTMFFVFSSLMPELAKNIKLMIALAPVAYMSNIKSPIRYLSPFSNDVEWLAKYLGLNQFLPNDKLIKFLAYDCELLKVDKLICENVIFIICGFDRKEFNQDILQDIFAKYPAGTSTKTVIHYAQQIKSNSFEQYDYGPEDNLKYYGQKTPPIYNVTNIRQPIYLMYGMNDWLADYIDVKQLAKQIKNLVGIQKVPLDSFNHVDFLFGKDAEKLVYQPVIKILKNFTAH